MSEHTKEMTEEEVQKFLDQMEEDAQVMVIHIILDYYRGNEGTIRGFLTGLELGAESLLENYETSLKMEDAEIYSEYVLSQIGQVEEDQ